MCQAASIRDGFRWYGNWAVYTENQLQVMRKKPGRNGMSPLREGLYTRVRSWVGGESEGRRQRDGRKISMRFMGFALNGFREAR